VVCLNTLGQDLEFSEDEKQFALKTVKMYKDTWDALEKKNLDNDVKLYLQHGDFDRLYRDHYITRDELRLEEIIEEAIAAANSQQVADGEDPLTEE
jgi:hypothetical protein